MRKIILFLFVVVLFTACAPEPLCKEPYLEFMEGECCLDEDNNGACDLDEVEIEVKEQEIVAEVVVPVEAKEYDMSLVKAEGRRAALDYMYDNQLGLSPALTFIKHKTNQNVYTAAYSVKYLVDLTQSGKGYVKVVYNMDAEKVVSVKFSNSLEELSY